MLIAMARIRAEGEPTVRDAPDKMDLKIAARIRQRRTFFDMSQADLAKRIGVIPQQVQKYESGVNRVSASRLHDIARALDVDIGWFFDQPDRKRPAADEIAADERRMLEAYRRLQPHERKRAIGILRALAA